MKVLSKKNSKELWRPIILFFLVERLGRIIGICLGSLLMLAMLLSFFGEIHGENVYFFEMKVPIVCQFKELTGVGCASCGLTRAWISLSHLEISQAISFNSHAIQTYSMAWLGMLSFFVAAVFKALSLFLKLIILFIGYCALAVGWIPIFQENMYLFKVYGLNFY
jgi:hypothetical protein